MDEALENHYLTRLGETFASGEQRYARALVQNKQLLKTIEQLESDKAQLESEIQNLRNKMTEGES